jgi:hypothetical protein
MRYSLSSRVRGIFLGALLGKSLAWGNNADKPCELSQMAVLGAQSLITCGRLDIEDWFKRQQQAAVNQAKIQNTSWEEIILATLPVAIFFHENTIKLRDNLLLVLQLWPDDPVLKDVVLAVGYAIAQSLTEKLNPVTFIPDTISFVGKTQSDLPETLAKINVLLTQQATLEKVRTEVNKLETVSNNLAIAFYCFLSTLEDFQLTVLRAAQKEKPGQASSISAIAGALSGAYNSTGGIPITWQNLFLSTNSSEQAFRHFAQILKLADALVAVWSGVYNLAPDANKLTGEEGVMSLELDIPSIFAAPRVIRPR